MNDKDFLKWIHNRLVYAYGENPYFGYMHRLRSIINSTDENSDTENSLPIWDFQEPKE